MNDQPMAYNLRGPLVSSPTIATAPGPAALLVAHIKKIRPPRRAHGSGMRAARVLASLSLPRRLATGAVRVIMHGMDGFNALRRLRGYRDRIRRQVGSVLAEGLFRGLSGLGRLHPLAQPHRHNVSVLRDIPYLDSGLAEHRLDVYLPQARPGPHPIVLYVHGGGFRLLSKESHWVMGLAFARRGYLVFNVNYRLAPRHRYPAAVADVCSALSWVARNAERYGGDPTRIVFAGESAGGNLVTALTIAACYERPEPWARPAWQCGVMPRATLPFCGILQVTDVHRFARRRKLSPWIFDRMVEVAEAYLGSEHLVPAPEIALADPLLVFEHGLPPHRPLPPFFAAVGTRDPILDDTRRLQAALGRLGVPCEARYYPGGAHAFHALVFLEIARECWRHTFAFLDRTLHGSVASVSAA